MVMHAPWPSLWLGVACGLVVLLAGCCALIYQRSQRRLHEQRQQRESECQSLVLQSQAHTRLVDEVKWSMHKPLQGLAALHDALHAHEDLSPQVRRYLKHAHDAVQHLQTLVNDLHDSTNTSSGDSVVGLRLTWAPCELRQVVHAAFDGFATDCRRAGLSYVCEIHDNVPRQLLTDGHRLQQVLVNLLSNATKFTPSGGVALRVFATTQRVHFEVEDTGIGIANAQQGVIFERFSQAHDNIQDDYGGHGLGLTISRQMVTQLGGTLGVRSVLGQGTCFWFDLPSQTQLNAA